MMINGEVLKRFLLKGKNKIRIFFKYFFGLFYYIYINYCSKLREKCSM